MNNETELEIVRVAQAMIRQGGYNSFSFRDIAATVGIKSSSVHYHFSTKEDLGAAVARYYTDGFIASLGEPSEIVASGKDPIIAYVNTFRAAAKDQLGMCLFGMLGAEARVLPERVLSETRRFFKFNIDWLSKAYRAKGHTSGARDKAMQTLSMIEGAMITSHVMGDIKAFNAAAKLLTKAA